MNNLIAINRAHYPELNFILWDTADELIDPKDAFYYYEKRWQYIDQSKLTKEEQELIDFLIQHVGKNLFLTA